MGSLDRQGRPVRVPRLLITLGALLPNALTVLRLVAGLLFPFCNYGWRLALLVYAGASDAIDGEVGRRLGATSDFGKLVDPIADKVVVIMVAATLVWEGSIEWWQLLLVASRDLAVLVISFVSWGLGYRSNMLTSPLIIGKVATGVQFIYLFAAVVMPQYASLLLIPVAMIVGLAAAAYVYDAHDQIQNFR